MEINFSEIVKTEILNFTLPKSRMTAYDFEKRQFITVHPGMVGTGKVKRSEVAWK